MKRNHWILTLTIVVSCAILAACAPRTKGSMSSDEMANDQKSEMQKPTESAPATAKADAMKSAKNTGTAMTNLKLTVAEAAITTKVENLSPVDPSTSFSSSAGTLYCFTKVLGASEPTTISHIWLFNNEQVAAVTLNVKSDSYRTYSSKNIWEGATGSWKVQVKDANGKLIKELPFEVK